MGEKGSGGVLKLSVGNGSLGTSLWEACGVCEDSIAKLYFWELLDRGALSATMPILFCAATRLA